MARMSSQQVTDLAVGSGRCVRVGGVAPAKLELVGRQGRQVKRRRGGSTRGAVHGDEQEGSGWMA